MKFLILVPDGMADFPVEAIGNKTPVAVARTPVMDELARRGVMGEFTPIPDRLPPGSDIGNLSMFGYDPRTSFTGRAPIEAANQGITLADDEVCFRCNIVSIESGVMKSFTAGHIDSDSGAAIIEALNDRFADDPDIRFHPGVQYRHLCVIRADASEHAELVAMATEPPHNITDDPVETYLPHGPVADRMNAYMTAARETIASHPASDARAAAGHIRPTDIWLWGQGTAPRIPPYADTFGLTGAVVSAVDLVKGIGRCAGFEVIDVPGATGYIDTNYEGKVTAALSALEDCDVAYIHIEAPDETAHEGRADLKIQAIEDFDAKVAAPCARYMDERDDVRILIAPDHVTSIDSKTHAGGPVLFLVVGAGIESAGVGPFDEETARSTGLCVDPGFELVQAFLRGQNIARDTIVNAASSH